MGSLPISRLPILPIRDLRVNRVAIDRVSTALNNRRLRSTRSRNPAAGMLFPASSLIALARPVCSFPENEVQHRRNNRTQIPLHRVFQ